MKNLKLILAGVIVLAALLGVFAGLFCGRVWGIEALEKRVEELEQRPYLDYDEETEWFKLGPLAVTPTEVIYSINGKIQRQEEE